MYNTIQQIVNLIQQNSNEFILLNVVTLLATSQTNKPTDRKFSSGQAGESNQIVNRKSYNFYKVPTKHLPIKKFRQMEQMEKIFFFVK